MATSKPCFVLIRGLMREQRHWGDFVDVLQKQFPYADIVTLDCPGNGHLFRQTSPKTIEGLTDGLRQQLSKRSEINLIALSMGGMIALDWMNRYPLEIKSAALINTSLSSYSPFFQRLRWQRYADIFSMFMQKTEQREQQILALTSNLHAQNRQLLNDWLQWQQQYPVSRTSAFNQLLAAARFSLKTKPRHPILLIAAKNDRLVDYRCSLKLKKAWDVDYQQHESAGHDIPLDDPDWLSQVISLWHKTV